MPRRAPEPATGEAPLRAPAPSVDTGGPLGRGVALELEPAHPESSPPGRPWRSAADGLFSAVTTRDRTHRATSAGRRGPVCQSQNHSPRMARNPRRPQREQTRGPSGRVRAAAGSGASSSWRDITRPLRGRRAGLTFATSSLSHAHWCPWWGDSLAREDARPGGYDPPGFFLWAGSWGGRYGGPVIPSRFHPDRP